MLILITYFNPHVYWISKGIWWGCRKLKILSVKGVHIVRDKSKEKSVVYKHNQVGVEWGHKYNENWKHWLFNL